MSAKLKGKARDRFRKKMKNKARNDFFMRRKANLLKIRKWGDPALKRLCEPVKEGEDIFAIAKELKEVLSATGDGVGLAAPQIGHTKNVIALRLDAHASPKIMINPEIVEKSETTGTASEGCLSFPGVYCRVERHTRVLVKYLDEKLDEHRDWKSGMEGIVIQHEVDHLSGVCAVGDHYFGLPEADQDRFRRKAK